MDRRSVGYLLLLLAAALAGVGLWRGSVRLFGDLDAHWLPRIIPDDYRRDAQPEAIDEQKQELAAAIVAGDDARTKKAESRLTRLLDRQAKWDKVVSRSYKLEAVIALACLGGAAWVGRVGWSRLRPAPDAEPSAAADPAS